MADLDAIVAGVQLRVGDDELRRQWTPERRETFLLNPAIDLPRSADFAAWRRVNDQVLLATLFIDYWGDGSPNGLSLHQGFRNAASVADTVGDVFRLVGIGFHADDFETVCTRHCIEPPPEDLRRVADRMSFLGYDVCDGWLVSGLCNCGVEEADAQARQRAEFAHRLNRHGLFADVADARAYAAAVDLLVPEHAFFLPVSLHVLER
ncbi:MAG: hypothetical protein ACFCVH_05100 [Alphaproteobacteria bacterium]